MHKFGPEDLQAFAQFFNLMLDVFLYGGSLMKAITDVDVHEHLGVANEDAHATKCYLSRIVHPSGKGKSSLNFKQSPATPPFPKTQGRIGGNSPESRKWAESRDGYVGWFHPRNDLRYDPGP
jgi:hypothetical protein